MTLEVLTPISIRFDGDVVRFPAGAVFTVTANQAARLLDLAPKKLRRITLPAASDEAQPPLQPGWLVSYRDRQGRLRGGCDERGQATVQTCTWNGRGWLVILTNGEQLPLSRIVSVGQTDAQGRVIAAWTVREHGFDGGGQA